LDSVSPIFVGRILLHIIVRPFLRVLYTCSLSASLCGVSALQGYLYFTRYNDKPGVRFLVSDNSCPHIISLLWFSVRRQAVVMM
jgi:hypothetical protein